MLIIPCTGHVSNKKFLRKIETKIILILRVRKRIVGISRLHNKERELGESDTQNTLKI